MQSRVVLLALVFGAIIFGISGFLPESHAQIVQNGQIQFILTETTCTNPYNATAQIPEDLDNDGIPDSEVIFDLGGSWNSGTCSISGDVELVVLEIDAEEVPVVLIVPGSADLEIEENASLTLYSGIESTGDITNFGHLTLEAESGMLLQAGSLTNGETGVVTVSGELGGPAPITNLNQFDVDDGEVSNNGIFTNTGTINIFAGVFTASKLFTNDGTINNDGEFEVTHFVNNNEFFNNAEARLDISGIPGTFSNENGSLFENSGTLDVDPSGEFIHQSGFSSFEDSLIELGGLITNHDTFTNNGNVNIKFSGKIVNLSTFINNGTIVLTSEDAQIAIFDGENGTELTNNGDIQNYCGVILGPFSGTAPVDNCAFELTILSPTTGSIESDVAPTTFSGVGQDRDPWGTPVGASSDIEWSSNIEGIIGSGSPLIFQLTALGAHEITASVLDENDNLIIATSNIVVSQVDYDKDGSPVQNDCDDMDDSVYPGAPEVFDGKDNNCDGNIDESFTDADNDGFDSTVDCNDDPDNNGAAMFPGNPEVIDGLDNDCVGDIPTNEIDSDGDFQIPSLDFDESTWLGDPLVTSGGDCDDGILYGAARYLGNTEIVDGIPNDCIDGLPDNETDDDGDGYIEGIFDITLAEFQLLWPQVNGDNDCADNDAARSPGLTEIDGDGIDNDCDGVVDIGVTDFDGDGYHTDGSGNGFDCKDDDVSVFTGAPELVDGLDNDCDGSLIVEEIDADSDGWIPGVFDSDGWNGSLQVLGDMDCNDIPVEGLNIHPTAPELPNGIDDDCDGVIPSNEIDNDGDGSFADLDCNDDDPLRSPDFEEVVDGLDNNCDDVLPDNEIDNDVDSFIDGIFDVNGWKGTPDVTGDNDCDDLNMTIYPGAPELLDGFDNDCDTILLDDEIDHDGDGQAEFQGDCDDSDKFNFSGNPEVDDGRDNDCDALVDEGFDLDGDGYTPKGDNDCDDSNPLVYVDALEIPDNVDNDCNGFVDDLLHKFTTPELQENLDDKTIRDYEKQVKELEEEIEDLEYENRKLDQKADKYEEKAEDALEGDTRKAAWYQKIADKFADKGYDKKAAYFQAKADKALEGDSEKAAKYQTKADELRAEIASNESLIEMYGKEILVIDMSIGNIPVDWSQTIVYTYDNLTDEAFDDILDDIKDNLEEIEKLEEKAVNYDEKADKEEAKGNQEKADKYRLKAIQAREEIEILEDLNTVLKCAIDFTDEMLLKEVEFSIKIDRDSDDAEEGNDSDDLTDMKLKSSDLDLVEESEYVGLRFNDIPLEKGQIIKSAYIQFTSEDKDSGNSVVTIYGQDIDDAPTFTNSDGNISSRTLTSASVTWNIPDWDDNKSKDAQQTSDVTSIIEEITSRNNWSEDNSIVFIITDGVGSDRDAYTYDEKSSKAAKLYITTLTDDSDHKHHHGHDHDDDDDRNGKGHEKHDDKYHDDDD